MRNPDITTTGAGEVRKCDQCTEPASTCAALTDSDSIVLAHRFLCETCAAAMFAVNVKQIDREAQLRNAVDRVKAKSSANEHVADFSQDSERAAIEVNSRPNSGRDWLGRRG
jgi:MinD superfamily P-loop ATPase